MRNKQNTATGWRRPPPSDQAPRRTHYRDNGSDRCSDDAAATEGAAAQTDLATYRAMLMEARESGKPEDLKHATAQLRRALDAEGWAA